ncbi:hypothetical protein JH26_10300 [Microvirga sp. BSC39]|nr:hypothetical protein JH26_10300 [Microvirga sp. BSC39]
MVVKDVGQEKALLTGGSSKSQDSIFKAVVGPDLLSAVDDADLELEWGSAEHGCSPLGVDLTEPGHVLVPEQAHLALLMLRWR